MRYRPDSLSVTVTTHRQRTHLLQTKLRCAELYRGYMQNKMISKLFQPLRLPKIILPEIISNVFQRLIAAHKYFQSSMSLK